MSMRIRVTRIVEQCKADNWDYGVAARVARDSAAPTWKSLENPWSHEGLHLNLSAVHPVEGFCIRLRREEKGLLFCRREQAQKAIVWVFFFFF